MVDDVPAYCRWDQMAFKGPLQPKPLCDTKISKSGCVVCLQRPESSALHLPELKESHGSRSRSERCAQISVAAAELKSWDFLVDILGVTVAPQDHLGHMSAHLYLQCK